ncbi:MAG: hypothetical protein ACJAQ3_002987, partial [Planctomycetota bacterium]
RSKPLIASYSGPFEQRRQGFEGRGLLSAEFFGRPARRDKRLDRHG